MTYAVTPTAAQGYPLTIDCPWCRRILPLCNGQRTVSEIAAALSLPAQVVLKLVQGAAGKGWLELPGEAARPTPAPHKDEHYRALQGELSILLGEKGRQLLDDALRMTRLSPAQLTGPHVADVLIALELLLTREQAERFGPQLDLLRETYAG